MITKDQLKKLIEQEETVYWFEKGLNNIIEIKLNNLFTIGLTEKSKFVKEDEIYSDDTGRIKFEKLFEKKSDAEFDAKFGHCEKVVKMPKPLNFGEVCKKVNYYYAIDICCLCVDYEEVTVYMRDSDGNSDELIFQKPLTEANYTEACEIVKKLFEEE